MAGPAPPLVILLCWLISRLLFFLPLILSVQLRAHGELSVRPCSSPWWPSWPYWLVAGMSGLNLLVVVALVLVIHALRFAEGQWIG